MPIFASTVTTVVVFLPMFYRRHRAFGIPLTRRLPLRYSFFVSRTVTPAALLSFLEVGTGGAPLAALLVRAHHAVEPAPL